MLYPQYFVDDLKNRVKIVRIVAALGFMIVSTVNCVAQDKPKALLVDKFGAIQCDDFLARVDNFYTQVKANSGSKGYFVIKGGKEFLSRKLALELRFESAVEQRAFDRTQTVVVRGDELGPLEISMGIVRAGDECPNFGETKWDLRISPAETPFELRSDMSQICDPPPVGKVARDLLDSNPNGSIFVVVHGPTARQRSLEFWAARKILAKFDSSRIRYLLRRSTISYSDYYFAAGNPKRTAFKSYF